jgi:predicted dehydrogenase/spore coat polysaccharide biosynthesis protein SpsF (cytidylyltransferase family)
MIERLKLAKSVDQIIVCTSTNPQDGPLEEIAAAEGVACFRGDEDDVVKRLSEAATHYDLDYILSITADCPFCDPEYADAIVDAYRETKADFIRALDLPHGAFSYGINPEAFRRVLEIKVGTDTEVWGRYFTDTDLFKVYDLPITNPLHNQPELRMTLDYPEDLEFFKAVFAAMYVPGQVFSLDEILTFLQEHPEVIAINSFREADYLKRWTRQSSIQLKPRYAVNRAVVIGAGSIGQRHIRNLHQLGITEIAALRSRQGPGKSIPIEFAIREITGLDQLEEFKPDVAIVSNPTSKHLDSISECLPFVRGVFVEKPLAATLAGVSELLEQISKRKVVSFVGYNLQFHAAVKSISKILNGSELGSPLVLQAQVGQWVGDWHPDEDYRLSYVSRRDLGGGVSLTLSHELYLAAELLGPVRGVFAMLSSSSLLELGVDVISDFLMQHSSGAISQIHLDMIQRPAHRTGTLSCERGWISYDLIKGSVVMQSAEHESPVTVWNNAQYDVNDAYVEEMRTFLSYVREGRVRHEHDAWKGARTLAIVEAAFESAKSKSFIDLERL